MLVEGAERLLTEDPCLFDPNYQNLGLYDKVYSAGGISRSLTGCFPELSSSVSTLDER